MNKKVCLPLLLSLIASNLQASIPTTYPTGNGPATVGYGSDGRLVYTCESNGDTLPDFSLAGYGGGGVPIPDVPVVTTLSPVSGDDTAQIQQAIDDLAAQPLGAGGFRGAVKLNAGIYSVTNTISIKASGIVLRGAGDSTNGTVLRSSTGATIFSMSGSGSRTTGSQTWEMTANYIPVGANWFALSNTVGLAVGDEILVCRRTNTNFESAVGHSLGDECWESVITEIDGNRIRTDTSITEAIEQQYGGGYVKTYSWPSRIENSGIEDIWADAPTVNVDTNGNTGGVLATISNLKNCWFRRCTNYKMRGHTMDVEKGTWVTIEDVVSFHNPLPGGHSGPSTQINTSDSSQGLLFHRVKSSDGGFEFTASSVNVGPIVFSECAVPHGFAFSGPHQKWNIGYLYDCLDMHHGLVVAFNGTGGWTAGNHLAWNCEETSNYTFERPPTAHQWIQGCIGPNAPVPPSMGGPPEVVSYGTHLEPASLYRAQLAEHVGGQAVLDTLGAPAGCNRYVLTTTTTSRSVSAGGSTTYPVTMTTGPLYSGQTVTFSATGLPSGASVSFSPASRTSSGSTTATIITSSSTPAGTYNIKIVGTGSFTATSGQSMTLAHPLFVKLTVTAPVTDFSVSATPSSQTVTPGNSTTYTVNAGSINGFSGTVAWSVSGLPAGATAGFNPASNTAPGSSTLTVTTGTSTPAGTNTLTITGTSGSLTHSTTVTLIVNAVATTLVFEAESLTVVTNTQTTTILSDANTSGGKFIQLNGVGAGDFVKFLVPNVTAATYDLRIGIKKNTNRAIVQTFNGKVGGSYSAFGPAFDEYSGSVSYTEVDLGAWTVSSSDKYVGFHVTGKNASSSGYVIAIDYIKLVPQ
jgi:hypothetical protein